MGKIKRKFDVQFKIQICQSIQSGAHTMAEVMREHQLQRSVIDGWLRRFDSGELEAKSPSALGKLEKENEKLKAKIGELTMEIDLLKKMEAWKRSQRSVDTSIITSKNLAQFQRPVDPPGSPSRATTTSPKKRR
jgi:transposase-like protein